MKRESCMWPCSAQLVSTGVNGGLIHGNEEPHLSQQKLPHSAQRKDSSYRMAEEVAVFFDFDFELK
jgi:hypothetical protein